MTFGSLVFSAETGINGSTTPRIIYKKTAPSMKPIIFKVKINVLFILLGFPNRANYKGNKII